MKSRKRAAEMYEKCNYAFEEVFNCTTTTQ
jgi:hypothetical protein